MARRFGRIALRRAAQVVHVPARTGGRPLDDFHAAALQVVASADDPELPGVDPRREDGLCTFQLPYDVPHVGLHGVLQRIARLVLDLLDRGPDRLDNGAYVPMRRAAGNGRRYRPATAMTEHHEQLRVEMFDGVPDAAQADVVDHVARRPHYKDVA